MTHKLHVQVSQHRFDAEGDPQLVAEQFKAWRELIQLTIVNQVQPDRHVDVVVNGSNETLLLESKGTGAANGESVNGAATVASHMDANDPLVNRTFAIDKSNLISLKALPNSANEAERTFDSLLLLIYGYYVIQSRDGTYAPTLMSSIRQSGIQLERLDRILDRYPGLVRTAGYKRGTRYSLTNPGISKAEDLIRHLYD